MRFRMVDRIVSYEPRRWIRGVKTVSFEEYSLRQPLGCEPGLPESLLVEALLQLGNWLIILSTDYAHMGLVLRWERLRFGRRPGPGESVLMEVVVRSWRYDGIVFDGVAWTNGQTAAEGTGCLAVPVGLEEYASPEHLRVLFSEIHRPDARRPEADAEPHGTSRR